MLYWIRMVWFMVNYTQEKMVQWDSSLTSEIWKQRTQRNTWTMRYIQNSSNAILWYKFYTIIHFNMVYYSIILDKYIHNVFTIVLPYVKWMHWGLPMGIFIGGYVFQEKMSKFLQDMVQACIYMDDLVIIRNNVFQNHVYILYEVLNWLEKPVMQVNAVKF